MHHERSYRENKAVKTEVHSASPEGMSPEEIRRMPDDALLDMDFFLNEDDEFDDDVGEEGFYIDFL